MEYINNEIIRKYIKKINLLKGGNSYIDKVNLIQSYINTFNNNESNDYNKIKDSIEKETEILNKLIDKYSVYKKLDKNKLQKITKKLDSEIFDLSKNKSNYDKVKFNKVDIDFDLSFYQNKLLNHIESKIISGSDILDYEINEETYTTLSLNISKNILKLKLLLQKLNKYESDLNEITSNKISHSLDPKNINSSLFKDSLNLKDSLIKSIDDTLINENFVKHSDITEDSDDIIKKNLTEGIIRNFMITSTILDDKLTDEIYKIINPIEILGKITYLPNNVKIEIEEVLVRQKEIRTEINNIHLTINKINKIIESIKKKIKSFTDEFNNLNFKIISVGKFVTNLLTNIKNNKVDIEKGKNGKDNIFFNKLRQLKTNKESLIGEYKEIVLKNMYNKNANEDINIEYERSLLPYKLKSIYDNIILELRPIDKKGNTNERILRRIKEIEKKKEKKISVLKPHEDNIYQQNILLRDKQSELDILKKEININLEKNKINWIQFGGSMNELIKNIIKQDQLVNEINFKYLSIKNKLNNIHIINNKINKINKNINFIKLIILLSIRHQVSNSVDTYKFFTKKKLIQIQSTIKNIKLYNPKDENDHILIFLNNYKILLDLLENIVTNIININILDDINAIEINKINNPSKRYFNFINLTFNLIIKLNNLIPDHSEVIINHNIVKKNITDVDTDVDTDVEDIFIKKKEDSGFRQITLDDLQKLEDEYNEESMKDIILYIHGKQMKLSEYVLHEINDTIVIKEDKLETVPLTKEEDNIEEQDDFIIKEELKQDIQIDNPDYNEEK